MLARSILILHRLGPWKVLLFTALLGWGNLFLTAMVAGTVRKFLASPGFMLGDLVFLPIALVLVERYYRKLFPVESQVFSDLRKSLLLLAGASTYAVAITLLSLFILRSVPLSLKVLAILSPHLLFQTGVAFLVLGMMASGVALTLRRLQADKRMPLVWYGFWLCMVLHQLLGLIFPKTFT